MGKQLGDVLVVGAGISGIQAALDLANSGFKVYLVDEAPAIGGKMAQLDKTFPTCDCSMCIESPKFIECARHPNIEIMTYTRIDRVEGEVGEFKVTLIKKPRYIVDKDCRGCGTCTQYCPVMIPDKFNEDLSFTKCTHVHFPQAVPLITYIDPEACLFLKNKKCTACIPVCENKAIDLYQKEEKVDVQVGGIILAPGYETFDPRLRNDYGYGKMKNVVTSLEFERILSASGPYQGEVERPSDGKPPKKVAWIQCVGSRQVLPGGNSYCSAICCEYTMKQVILAKDHDSELEATIFHNDIRAYGKDFERFYQRAKNLSNVRFIRSYVTIGGELSESHNITIKYSNGSRVEEEEFEMVVLSVGLVPPSGAEKLAEQLSIDLNQHRFSKANGFNILKTSRPGIFASGAFLCPMDIPESVVTASGASSLCGQFLSKRRGKLAKPREYPSERDVSSEEPRVGVFVCRCGTNIGRVVDVPSVVQFAATLSNVVYSEENLFSCSADMGRHIAEAIREKKLNRVVVAACTPRTHEPLFQDTLREGGINKYLFVMANIREHCSWVHSREKDRATAKAKDIVQMAVARAIQLKPLEELEVPLNKKGLVVGGGLAGMTSSLSLAKQGFEVYLVEKNLNLGGIAQRIHYTLDGMDVQAYLKDIVHQVYQNQLIHVYTNSVITEAFGFAGNFTTKIMSGNKSVELNHGITIIATGAEEYRPTEYLYGKDDRVLTLLELEERIAKGDANIINAKNLAIILCVGCRTEDRPYCSRVCCGHAVKCALKLKKINPEMDISIFYQDMMMYGFKEDYYREVASQEVKFIRYEAGNKPQVEATEDSGQSILRITVSDPVLEENLFIDADVLALAAAIVPSASSKELSRLYRVSLSPDRFFMEAHAKLRPVDFATDGVFLCGMAHYPKYIPEAIAQAYGAAERAITILSQDSLRSSGAVCEIDESECIGCGVCQKVCPYGAIELYEVPAKNGKKAKKARVISPLCKGDGACNSRCPSDAMTLHHFTDTQIYAQINEAFSVRRETARFEPKILAFLCNWCGYAGSDLAGVSRMQYASNIRVIRVMCSARVHSKFIFESFLKGMDAVLVVGCHVGDCHYISGINETIQTIETTKKNLEKIGINPERLRLEYISAAEGAKFAEVVNDFNATTTKLGPLGLIEQQKEQLSNLKKAKAHKQPGAVEMKAT